MKRLISLLFVNGLAVAAACAGTVVPLADKVPCAIIDRQDLQVPDRVQLAGWVGGRIMANESNRLAKIDTARLLEGYKHRPGRQTWDGEHVGKWLHAATLAWVNTGDPLLRAKLDETVAELVKCQLEDGYLGTYVESERWTAWDVWAHKYNLIGLLTYMRYTGNVAPLETCRRMADLLCRDLGEGAGQRDIITAGEQHVGMASTSVLEPMVLLYRFTGERRYLEFCDYILRAWEQPNGPHIISRLLEGRGVNQVGNGKAYEMLSCLNGALEFYRTTGDNRLLQISLNAWEDIVAHHLYLTGAASIHEYFRENNELPNTDNVGETCVTVTWLQFNAQLLRLTGEAKFAEQLERVVLNQLFGAQRPDCAAWGYYVQMEGRKPYSTSLDGHCCLSSGPRGVALVPSFAVATDTEGIAVNLYDRGAANLELHDGTKVSLATETGYPTDGSVRLRITSDGARRFAVKLRIPEWCRGASAQVNGVDAPLRSGAYGYAVLRREWMTGDIIDLQLPLAPRVVIGEGDNLGKVAILYGPLVLAADEAPLAALGQRVTTLNLPGADRDALGIVAEPAKDAMKTWPGAKVFRVKALAAKDSRSIRKGELIESWFVPFADAGGTGSRYRVWLPVAGGPAQSENLLLAGEASCSRADVDASGINDDDLYGSVNLRNKPPAEEAWFAVRLAAPAHIRRVVFVQGEVRSDGGWFDASASKPRIQIQRSRDGEWETVGGFIDYPATTATDRSKLVSGQQFELLLPASDAALAVRVVGNPSRGNKAGLSFVSAGELQAFGRPHE